VLHGNDFVSHFWQHTFQSSPGPEARCYKLPPSLSTCHISFQSSPGPEARCYAVWRETPRHQKRVSILTGPGGPVLHCGARTRASCTHSFNPHRARRPGAT